MQNNNSNVVGTGVSTLDDAYMLSKGKCVKRMDVGNVVKGIVIMLVGIMLIMIPQVGIVSNPNFTSAFYMFGLIGCCYALYVLLAKNRCMVYEPTGSKVVYKQMYYDIDALDKVKAFVNNDKVQELPQSLMQGGTRLRTFVAADGSMACVQISHYRELTYENVGDPVIITGEKVLTLRSLRRSKRE